VSLQLTLHAVFALVFGGIAWMALPRGWQFLKIGWSTLQANASQPDRDTNYDRQQLIREGTRFFIAGLGWAFGGVVSAGTAVVLAYLAIGYL
jgi:hypothetical protein